MPLDHYLQAAILRSMCDLGGSDLQPKL